MPVIRLSRPNRTWNPGEGLPVISSSGTFLTPEQWVEVQAIYDAGTYKFDLVEMVGGTPVHQDNKGISPDVLRASRILSASKQPLDFPNAKLGPVSTDFTQVVLNQTIGNLAWATRQYTVGLLSGVADLGEGLVAELNGFKYSLTAFQFMPRSIRTIVTGDKFAWCAAGGAGAESFMLYIDGRPAKLTPYSPAAGVTQFHQITFPNAKPEGRLVEIRTSDGIAAIYVEKPHVCYKPPPRRGPRILCITDSFGSNAGATLSMDSAYWDPGPHFGSEDVWTDHQGGSGIGVTSGATGVEDPQNSFLDRIEPITANGLTWDIAQINPDYTHIHSGFANDFFKGVPLNDCIANGVQLFRRLRQRLPDTKLGFVEGFITPGNFKTFRPNYIAAREALQEALLATGVYYIDVATTDPWIKGAGWVGNVNADGELANIAFSADSDHPSTWGHAFIKARMGRAVRTILLDDGRLLNKRV